MLQLAAIDNKGKALRMTADIALDLALMFEATRRMVAEPLKRTTVISSWSALVSYLKVTLAHEPREQFRILFLDKRNQLIADEIMGRGTVDHAPAYPREIMRRALELDDLPLSPADEALVRERSADYHANPAAVVSLEEMVGRLQPLSP